MGYLVVYQTVQTSWTTIFFTHISIFRFIQIFKEPVLLNRQLYVNMGEERGGLLCLDHTVYTVSNIYSAFVQNLEITRSSAHI